MYRNLCCVHGQANAALGRLLDYMKIRNGEEAPKDYPK